MLCVIVWSLTRRLIFVFKKLKFFLSLNLKSKSEKKRNELRFLRQREEREGHFSV
jgi:hypothetical protein